MSGGGLAASASCESVAARNMYEPLPAKTLFHARYEVCEELHDSKKVTYAVDRLSRNPVNLPVLIKAYDDRSVWQQQVEMLREMRSEFVSRMLDAWSDDTQFPGRSFIVVERGGLRLSEYMLGARRADIPLPDPERRVLLREILTCLVFLSHQGYDVAFHGKSFMQFGKSWKVVDFRKASSRRGHERSEENPLYVAPGVAEAVINGEHSLKKAVRDMGSPTLGTILLEFLMLEPLFHGRQVDEVYSMVRFASSFKDRLSSERDRMALRLMRVVTETSTLKGRGTLRRYLSGVMSLLPDGVAEADAEPGKLVIRPHVAGFLPATV